MHPNTLSLRPSLCQCRTDTCRTRCSTSLLEMKSSQWDCVQHRCDCDGDNSSAANWAKSIGRSHRSSHRLGCTRPTNSIAVPDLCLSFHAAWQNRSTSELHMHPRFFGWLRRSCSATPWLHRDRNRIAFISTKIRLWECGWMLRFPALWATWFGVICWARKCLWRQRRIPLNFWIGFRWTRFPNGGWFGVDDGPWWCCDICEPDATVWLQFLFICWRLPCRWQSRCPWFLNYLFFTHEQSLCGLLLRRSLHHWIGYRLALSFSFHFKLFLNIRKCYKSNQAFYSYYYNKSI